MSFGDKISNKAEDLTGKAKETAGQVTGDEQLASEGKTDQAKAGLKDAVGDAMDKLKDTFRKS